jgi:hypothetical protein
LLQQEVQLGKAGVLALHGKDRLVDDGHAERGLHAALVPGVAGLKGQGRQVAGSIDVPVGRDGNVDVGGRVDDDQPRVADDGPVEQHLVGVQLDRAIHVGAGGHRKPGHSVLYCGRAGGQRLSLLDDVQVDAAVLDRGQGGQAHRLADDIGGAVGAQEHRVAALVDVEPDRAARREARLVLGSDVQAVRLPGLGHKGKLCQAVRAAGQFCRAVLHPFDAYLQARRRGAAVGVGGENVDAVLDARLEHAALGDGLDDQRLRGEREHLAGLLGVVGLVNDGHFQRVLRLLCVQPRAGQVLGQVKAKDIGAVLVGLAAQLYGDHALDVPHAADDLYLPGPAGSSCGR